MNLSTESIISIVHLLGREHLRADRAEKEVAELREQAIGMKAGLDVLKREHALELADLAADVERLQLENARLTAEWAAKPDPSDIVTISG